jgi:diacylglycerol kinase (ATP)
LQNRTLLSSFKFACEGLGFALKGQRNLRIHFLTGLVVIIAGILLKLTYLEMAIILLVTILVIICEIINTAIELSIDFLNGKKHHPLVKMVKDMVAAAVLLAAINAVVVGVMIFVKHI